MDTLIYPSLILKPRTLPALIFKFNGFRLVKNNKLEGNFMKHHLPSNNTLITREIEPSSAAMTRISPLALSLGCALFFGSVQTASAATSFTLSLAPPGSITALVNTNILYTATLTETGTTASTGTTTIKSTFPWAWLLCPVVWVSVALPVLTPPQHDL